MQNVIIRKGLVTGIILMLFMMITNTALSINTDYSANSSDIPRLKAIGILFGNIKNLSQDEEHYNFNAKHLFLILLIHDGSHWQPFFTYLDSSYTFLDGSKTFRLPKNSFHGRITQSFVNGFIIEWYNIDYFIV